MKVIEDFDLTEYNSYRIRTKCKRAVFLESEQDVLEYFSNKSVEKVLLGSGHNVILSKSYYEQDFVIFNGNYNAFSVDQSTGTIEAESGITMTRLSMVAQGLGLSGLEVFYDIPSSLGGAVIMNAGASGEEIKDVLIKVRYLDMVDMEVKEIDKESIGFEYRNSFFQINTDKIVLKAWLKLIPKDPISIQEKMNIIKAARWAKQPRDFPNAGSVFKRPKGYYVGALMDELNLKGYTVGGAKISEKHGGFIVNFNNASGNDILSIIKEVQSKVNQLTGIELEIEQRII